MTKKNFSNSLAEAVSVLSEGKITEQDYSVPEKNEKLQKPDKKKPNKILLRIDPDVQAALQKEARKIAAEEDRNYSLTELINDILKKYLQEI